MDSVTNTNTVVQTSPSYSLNKSDLAHIGRHFVYSALGAGVAYLLSGVIPNLQLDGFAAVSLPIITAILVSLQSYLKDNSAN